MPLEDGLQLVLASERPSSTLGELLDEAFPWESERRSQAIAALDVTENPDAPEMYAAVAGLVSDWRRGRCALRFFINHGPEINVSEEPRPGRRAAAPKGDAGLLDLVIEQRPTPLEFAVRAGHWSSTRQLLEWLQDHTLLVYAGAKGRFRQEGGPGDESNVARAAGRMLEKGFLAATPEDGSISLTQLGEQELAGLMDEAESDVERYGVFADVLYDEEAEGALFGTGRGDDLTVAVCEAEGLDPVRTVYLLRMYDYSLDESLDSWWEAGGSEEFYDWLLAPAVDNDTADEALLDRIIEAGLAHVEERQETRLARARQRVALNRAEELPD
jgi:hypothetical protein